MLRNYFKIAIRNLWKYKLYSFINVFGLMIGLTCSLLILLWVKDELSINQFHQKIDRIYQVRCNMIASGGTIDTWGNAPQPLGEVLEDKYPEIEHALLIPQTSHLLEYAHQPFTVRGIYTKPDFFNVFSFPILEGDVNMLISTPLSMAISERLAIKLFGTITEAVGQTVKLENAVIYSISAVFETPSDNSTLDFDFVMTLDNWLKSHEWDKDWGNFNHTMYVQVQEGVDVKALNKKIAAAIFEETGENEDVAIFLQPFKDTYLHSKFENGKAVGGRIEYVRIFFFAAVFLLLIACINFMNLATARASKRTKEVGVRKAVGANRQSLIFQFLGEALLLTVIAVALAIGLTGLLLPEYHQLVDKKIYLDYTSISTWLTLGGLTVLTALLAGAYPAFLLSSVNTVNVIKGDGLGKFKGGHLRKVLVVCQFMLSIFLIVGALVIHRQIQYIQNKDLGVDSGNVLYLSMKDKMFKQNESFRQFLSQETSIESFTQINQNPINVGNNTNSVTWEEMPENDDTYFSVVNTDHNFLKTLKPQLLQGRDFSEAYSKDSLTYIINEAAAQVMGMEEPVGQRLQVWGSDGRIIGLIKDYHFRPLHTPITPFILRCSPQNTGILFVRAYPGKTKEAIAVLERAQQEYAPAYPLNYRFLDASLERAYRSEFIIGKLANYFALIAIFISCMGLFGLIAFLAEQKAKEISIRKVLGATVMNIITLLSKDFLKLVGIAFVLATPVAYWALNNWLQKFAYHITIEWWLIAAAGGIILLIALATTSMQSIRSALSNPAAILRSE